LGTTLPTSRQSCGEESELSRILIKNGYVVTIDGARNVYPSAPAAREAGASGVRQFDTSAGSDGKRKAARAERENRRTRLA
jgi:hypothetical protein